MGTNTLLCHIECHPRVLPGWMFVRHSEGLMCQVPFGKKSPLRGDVQVPISLSGNIQNNL